ncbi:hypothetical protein QQP08_015855, partial [Theobroma cacao]
MVEITSNSLSEVTSLGTSINPCGFPVYLEKEVKSHGSTDTKGFFPCNGVAFTISLAELTNIDQTKLASL